MNKIENLIIDRNKLVDKVLRQEKKLTIKLLIYAFLVVAIMTIFNNLIFTFLAVLILPMLYTHISINKLHKTFLKIYNIDLILLENNYDITKINKSKNYLIKESLIKELYSDMDGIENLYNKQEIIKEDIIMNTNNKYDSNLEYDKESLCNKKNTNDNDDVSIMFKLLKENIGNYIRCIYLNNGKLQTKILKLERVDEYESIYSDFSWIHFFTNNERIIKIETLDGKMLYENKLYEINNINEENQIDGTKVNLYEKNYLLKNENIKELMDEGLKYIDKSLSNEWLNYIYLNEEYIALATISLIKKINEGMNFYQAESITYTSEFLLSGEEMNQISDAVIRFSSLGKSYSMYRDKCNDQTKRKKKIK